MIADRWKSRGLRATVWLLAGVAGLGAPSDANADPGRQEEIAMAWIEAHNSGDVERMRAFRNAHREGGQEGWEEQFERLVQQLGTLEVTDVMIGGDGQMAFGVESENDGRLRFDFRFSEADPERLAGIRIESWEDSRPNDLPPVELPAGDWTQVGPALDAYLERLAADGRFSGSVLIADGDTLRFEGAYGQASREFSVPNTMATRFDIGSITKDFTRVAIAQLAAAGKLGIDDTVGKHLPDYPNAQVREKVTVRHLFEHRSGIGDYFTAEWLQTPMGALQNHQDYIAIWGPKPLEFEPGKGRSYSNFGFTVLGAIIDKVSGQPYFDYVAEHIFKPAGMTSSGFFATDAIVPDVAVGYTRMVRGGTFGETLRKNIYLEPVVGGPWGKTYSTAKDLWRFWTAVSRHKLTDPAYTRWMLLSGPAPEGDQPTADATPVVAEIALGGGGPGLSASIEVVGGRVIIVLANQDPPSSSNLNRRIAEALEK